MIRFGWFVRDIEAPLRFRLGRFCAEHKGTMEVQIRWIICLKVWRLEGSDWVDFVRDVRSPWRFRLGAFCD